MIQLEVVEENYGPVDGKQEQLFTTPASVCRIFRGPEYTKRIVVSTEGSYDPNDLPLTGGMRPSDGNWFSGLRWYPLGYRKEHRQIFRQAQIPGGNLAGGSLPRLPKRRVSASGRHQETKVKGDQPLISRLRRSRMARDNDSITLVLPIASSSGQGNSARPRQASAKASSCSR